jgi:hypothetical protein
MTEQSLANFTAIAALIVSLIALWISYRAKHEAKRVADIEEARDLATTALKAQIIVANHDNEGPGPQSYIKILLTSPQNGDIIQLNELVFLRNAPHRFEIKHSGYVARQTPFQPPVTVDGTIQVNLVLHHLARAGATEIRLAGVRLDAVRSRVSIDIKLPDRSDTIL